MLRRLRRISECPPMYLVALWITISIPKSMGFWFTGLAKVLSIMEISSVLSWPIGPQPFQIGNGQQGVGRCLNINDLGIPLDLGLKIGLPRDPSVKE